MEHIRRLLTNLNGDDTEVMLLRGGVTEKRLPRWARPGGLSWTTAEECLCGYRCSIPVWGRIVDLAVEPPLASPQVLATGEGETGEEGGVTGESIGESSGGVVSPGGFSEGLKLWLEGGSKEGPHEEI
ncbi:hypothetical protein GOP47_0017289 [Adiantum capillus-veneris]|uniref:Uncharacterized protein n=1 Tax=Adiantum capillus-veneris TaxID=13818 RepID=A0A9D4ZBL5_ADICA|nr:hypothetical protein GOP47_0017289 [Adiantum capillus-veneris]